MTIEEKARAYDEALDRCKEWASGTWGHSVDDSPKDIAEFIFPQLAENEEDAKIREVLIDFFDSALGKDLLQRKCGLNPDAVLAYLEKQKAPHFTKRNALFDKCVENCDPEVMKKVSDEIDEMLQKEQKPFNVCEQCPYYKDCPNYIEQKSADESYNQGFVAGQKSMKEAIEKGFGIREHSLDYLAGTYAGYEAGKQEQKPAEIDEYKIIKKHITEDSLSSEVNKRLKECGWYVTDTESSEWSEEDEKDIAHIIRVLDDCYAYGKHDLSKTDHENLVGTLKSIHPQLKSEWSDEDEGELQNAIDALEFLGKKGVYESESGYDAALKAASWLKSFRLQLKLDWSKEDKVYLEDALWCVKQAAKVAKDENGMGACWSAERWLNSLPERFNLEPKQEWNKEDDKMLSRCIKSIESSKQFAASSVYEKDKEINWIKSLSERFNLQPNPEWSEEDKRKLDGIIQWLREYQKKFNPKYDNLSIESIDSLINWLKFLRSSWKPTKEQMDALRDVIKTVPMTCRQQVPLESLYSDLNKNL